MKVIVFWLDWFPIGFGIWRGIDGWSTCVWHWKSRLLCRRLTARHNRLLARSK